MKLNKVDDKTAYENLLVKYAELEQKLADQKANFDYFIEGQNLKIKELEQKLEQTEKDLADYQFNYPSIKELEKENNKLLDVINNQDVKIADLEKQITALEAKNIELSENWRADHDTLVFYDEKLEKENAELKEQNSHLYNDLTMTEAENAGRKDQLIKAKEIINNLMLEVKGYEEVNGFDTCEPVQKAEQFLKEIEK